MAGRYDDDREWRDRDHQRGYDDRRDAFGDEGDRYGGREDRTFGRNERVFGEQESGVAYNRPQRGGASEGARGGRGWQDPKYGGVSPAMQRGDYESGYRSNPRFAGADPAPRGYGGDNAYDREGHRFGSYEADQRWAREMRRPPSGGTFSGGTGGYDYERGYGDGGREQGGDMEDRARDAGDFFRRTGRRISNWFSDVAGEGSSDRGYGEDRQRYEEFRGARGRGPKGYQRSDERINEDVHHHLTDDHYLDASDIDVAVSQGDVTLSGTVQTREAKHRAERLVEDLPGVKHVQNNIRVQPSVQSYTTRDDYSPLNRGSGAATGQTGYAGGSGQSATMASSEPVKDVTDGNAAPPAQKRN